VEARARPPIKKKKNPALIIPTDHNNGLRKRKNKTVGTVLSTISSLRVSIFPNLSVLESQIEHPLSSSFLIRVLDGIINF